jgi:hypothetical protein
MEEECAIEKEIVPQHLSLGLKIYATVMLAVITVSAIFQVISVCRNSQIGKSNSGNINQKSSNQLVSRLFKQSQNLENLPDPG